MWARICVVWYKSPSVNQWPDPYQAKVGSQRYLSGGMFEKSILVSFVFLNPTWFCQNTTSIFVEPRRKETSLDCLKTWITQDTGSLLCPSGPQKVGCPALAILRQPTWPISETSNIPGKETSYFCKIIALSLMLIYPYGSILYMYLINMYVQSVSLYLV